MNIYDKNVTMHLRHDFDDRVYFMLSYEPHGDTTVYHHTYTPTGHEKEIFLVLWFWKNENGVITVNTGSFGSYLNKADAVKKFYEVVNETARGIKQLERITFQKKLCRIPLILKK